jgi:oligopeptide/dipeptide ABC transporter ATP-binding protein
MNLSREKLCAIRGSEISMIFQEPMTSLNPVMKVGSQVDEAVRIHMNIPASEVRKKTIEMFEAVGIPEPAERCGAYPHELSGGLRQRVMIAMAMICHPRLLIADEPTTALDVTVEAQILRLMRELNRTGTSILLISHNLSVIAQVCDHVYVMYAGQILEEADVDTLFDNPLHPYTKALIEAIPTTDPDASRELQVLEGDIPSPVNPPSGCKFHTRCRFCTDICRHVVPEWRELEPDHFVACHHPLSLGNEE